MSKYKKIFDSNMERVDSLCALYEKLKDERIPEKREQQRHTDVLRAATVFLHSAFEDYYRNILYEWLPKKADADVFKGYPLPNSKRKRAEKFSLDELLSYREKKVDDLIKESVDKVLQETSFNNYTDVASWADKIELQLNEYKKQSVLNTAITRRHKIVHEADRQQLKTDELSRLSPIQLSDLEKWKVAYKELVNIIDAKITQWEDENEQTDCR